MITIRIDKELYQEAYDKLKKIVKKYQEFKNDSNNIVRKHIQEPMEMGKKYFYIRIDCKTCYRLINDTYLPLHIPNSFFYGFKPNQVLFKMFILKELKISYFPTMVPITLLYFFDAEINKLEPSRDTCEGLKILNKYNLSVHDKKVILENTESSLIEAKNYFFDKVRNKIICIKKDDAYDFFNNFIKINKLSSLKIGREIGRAHV